MEQRFYFDTSVFRGIYDIEFDAETTLLFEKVFLGQIKCVYLNLTKSELANAPENVRIFFERLPNQNKESLLITPKALKLAQTYIKEKLVGEHV